MPTANTGSYRGTYALAQVGAVAGDLDTAVRLTGGGSGGIVVPDARSLDYGDTMTYELWVRLVTLPAAGTVGNLMTKSTGTAALRVLPSGAFALRSRRDRHRLLHDAASSGRPLPLCGGDEDVVHLAGLLDGPTSPEP
jgi:hypothetical protein